MGKEKKNLKYDITIIIIILTITITVISTTTSIFLIITTLIITSWCCVQGLTVTKSPQLFEKVSFILTKQNCQLPVGTTSPSRFSSQLSPLPPSYRLAIFSHLFFLLTIIICGVFFYHFFFIVLLRWFVVIHSAISLTQFSSVNFFFLNIYVDLNKAISALTFFRKL